MNFPDVSTYPEEQRCAINRAKESWNSVFRFGQCLISIKKESEFFTITACLWDVEVGKCWSSDGHYGLIVDKQNQRKWIWKILYTTKVWLDGILSKKWSWRYSRALFLIKAGYMPTSWTRPHQNSNIFPITDEDKVIIYEWLRRCSFENKGELLINIAWDRAILYFEYNPDLAIKFLEQMMS